MPNLVGMLLEGLQEDLEVERLNAQIKNTLPLLQTPQMWMLHMFGNGFVSKSIVLYIGLL